MGGGARRRPLHPLVPAAHGGNRRETRLLRRTRRTGRRARRVLRQAARPAGTRCLVVPQRRNPQHVRSARLLRLGPRVARLHRRLDALHPDRVHRLHGRGARLQDPAAALAGSRRQGRDGSMPLLRPQRHEGFQLPGLGAGVLPRGRSAVGRTPRPGADGPHAHGPRIGQEPAARRPLFRRDSRTRDRIHARPGIRIAPVGHSRQNPPQRSGAQPIRAGAHLRGSQPGQRPQPAADDDHEQDRPPPQLPHPAPREALQGGQRFGQTQQLVAGHRHGRQPARAGQDALGEPPIHHLSGQRHGGRPTACSKPRS